METVEGHHLGFEALAKVRHTPGSRKYTDDPDPGSVLQGRRDPCHHLRLQH